MHDTKQVWSILELLQLNPLYYLDATKAQTQCLQTTQLHQAVCLREQDPHFHFVVLLLKTFGGAKWPRNKAENVQACSWFQLMYIMVSLCRSHNNRRHEHKCLQYYVSDGVIDGHFAQTLSYWQKKSCTFGIPFYGVFNITPLLCIVSKNSCLSRQEA